MSATPGPWKVVDDVSEGVWIATNDDKAHPICDIVGRVFDKEAMTTQITAEDMANARLIAAAPDLLEALKQLLEDTRHMRQEYSDADEAAELARVAIEKAGE